MSGLRTFLNRTGTVPLASTTSRKNTPLDCAKGSYIKPTTSGVWSTSYVLVVYVPLYSRLPTLPVGKGKAVGSTLPILTEGNVASCPGNNVAFL